MCAPPGSRASHPGAASKFVQLYQATGFEGRHAPAARFERHLWLPNNYEEAMNILDGILILLLITGIVLGVQRGFLRTSVDLIVLIVAAISGALLYRPLASIVLDRMEADPATINAGALVLSALLVLGFLNILVTWAVSPHLAAIRAIRPVRLIDNGFGVLPGLVYGLLFGAMVTVLVGLIPFGDGVNRTLAESELAQRLRGAAQSTTTTLARETGMDLADFTYIVTQQEGVSYRIPPNVDTDLVESEQAEAEIAELVNQERANRGLPTLAYDPSLVPVARAHSAEMLEIGYFSHTSPNTGSLRDRLRTAGISYQTAGENLAYAPTVDVAHRGLMQSDGHRRNILEPTFEYIGVGVIVAPDGTLMVTQLFAEY
jgi:uncharacterized protein YkwD/uncharacterized membrane protein required for colicin V production